MQREESRDRPLVELIGIGKRYSMGHTVVDALKNIHLEVKQGDSVAIMGPSGSGKSTMLHLLGCLDTPSVGQYFLDQSDVSRLSDRELALIRATHIGFVFQSFNLIPQLNVFENIKIPFLYRPTPPADLHEKILLSAERVGLSHRINHLPSELSGGEMQRTAIARALAIDPLIILADEPTGNLDSATGKTILNLFQRLNEQGVTLMIVTHDENVGAHCRRMIRMRDGQIVSDL